MLRRHPDGWSPWRQALFALVPVLLGTAVVVAGDGPAPAPGLSRIEATRVGPAVAEVVEPAPESALPAPGPAGAGAGATVEVAPGAVGDGGTVEAGSSTSTSTVPGVVSGETGAAAPVAVARPAPAPAPSPDSTVATTTTPGPAPASTTTTAPPPTTTTTAPAPSGPSRTASAAAEVVPLTNADRAASGLGALSRNGCLDSVASGFAEQMARSEVLAHNAGAGPGVLGCRPGATWGDNVGRAVPCDTALLQRQWMASPGHRRNILTGAFTQIGVGAWTGEDGTCWIQVLFSS